MEITPETNYEVACNFLQQTITDASNFSSNNCMWYDPWQPYVKQYWPVYVDSLKESRTEQAFKILQKLIELKIAKVETVNDFIEAVNKIASVL